MKWKVYFSSLFFLILLGFPIFLNNEIPLIGTTSTIPMLSFSGSVTTVSTISPTISTSTTTVASTIPTTIPATKVTFGFDNNTYNYTKNPVNAIGGNGIVLFSNPTTIPTGKVTNYILSPNVSVSINALKLGLISITPTTIKAYNSSGHYDVSHLPSPHGGVYTVDVSGITGNVTYTVHYPSGTPQSGLAPYLLENGAWIKLEHFNNNILANTITFNASADPTFGVDGSASTTFTSATLSHSVTLSTTNVNDMIFLIVAGNRGGNQGVTNTPLDTGDTNGAMLTWHLLEHLKASGGQLTQDVYWANALNTLTNDQISENVLAGMNGGQVAFGVSDANVVTPFDPNAGFPYNGNCGAGCTGLIDVTGVTTSNPNDFIFGSFATTTGCGCLSANTPFVNLDNWGGNAGGGQVSGETENQIVTSTQASVTVSINGDTGDQYVGMVEALQQASAGGGGTFTVTASPNPPQITNTIIDVGQISAFNSIISGGLAGYAINALILPPATATGLSASNTLQATVSNVVPDDNAMFVFNAVSSTKANLQGILPTNLFAVNVLATSNLIYGQWSFNIVAFDNNGVGSNSITTKNVLITVNPAFSLSGNTISNAIADQGQIESLTEKLAGGTNGFTYNYLVTNTNSGNIIYNSIQANIIQNQVTYASANAVQFTLTTEANVIGTLTFDANAVDTASTNALTGVGVNTFTVHKTPTTAMSTTNTLLDSNQYIVFRIAHNNPGGAGSFTDNFINVTGSLTYNTVPGVTIGATSTNTQTVSSPTDGNVFTWQCTSNDIGTTTTYGFGCSQVTITVNSVLVAGAITPSSPIIDNGQSQTLTSHPAHGTLPYTYQWYSDGVCSSTIGGATSSTYVASPTSTTTYTYQVTDSATTPVGVCSSGDTVTVNPKIAPVLTGNTLLDSGQLQVFSGSWTGGTSPFFISFYNETGSITFNTINPATSPTTNIMLVTSLTDSNTFTWNDLVTDTSPAGAVTKNSLDFVFVVNTVLHGSTNSVSNPTQTSGQPETLKIGVIGGTSPYTYNFMISNTNTGNIIFNALISNSFKANAITFTLPVEANDVGLVTFTANVVDGATLASNILSHNTITVTAGIVSNAVMAINSLVIRPNSLTNSGTAYTTFNAVISGGQSTYTYDFVVFSPKGIAVQNIIDSGIAGTSNILNFTYAPDLNTGLFTINLIVTDSGGGTNTLTNTLFVSLASNPGGGGGGTTGFTPQVYNYAVNLTNNTATYFQQPSIKQFLLGFYGMPLTYQNYSISFWFVLLIIAAATSYYYYQEREDREDKRWQALAGVGLVLVVGYLIVIWFYIVPH